MSAEPICPMTEDGRHKVLKTAWGQSCKACHKTWQWVERELVPTWPTLIVFPSQEGVG